MNVRSLRDRGIHAFADYLRELRKVGETPVPRNLLTGEQSSEALSRAAPIRNVEFADAMAAARYLNDVLASLSEDDLQSSGVWTWLALFYFDQLCPANQNGLRKPKADERYILSQDGRKRYRHLLEGPYRMVRMHGDRARVMLRHPVHIHSDLSEQLSSRQEIATNAALIEAADILYYDVDADRPKRGVTDRDRGGTVRRLVAVSQQFDRTYDIYSLSGEELVGLLPEEFQRWL